MRERISLARAQRKLHIIYKLCIPVIGSDANTKTSRWHTRTPNAPKEQGDSWVVQRDKAGIGYGKNIRPPQHEILVGENKWVSKQEWQKAIRAKKNGVATDEQKEMLDNGHWKPKK